MERFTTHITFTSGDSHKEDPVTSDKGLAVAAYPWPAVVLTDIGGDKIVVVRCGLGTIDTTIFDHKLASGTAHATPAAISTFCGGLRFLNAL